MMRKNAGGEGDFGEGFGNSDDGFQLTTGRERVGFSICTLIS